VKRICSSTSFIRSLSGETPVVDLEVFGAGVVAGVDADDLDDEHQFFTSIKSMEMFLIVAAKMFVFYSFMKIEVRRYVPL
jgi:hypothetical protein